MKEIIRHYQKLWFFTLHRYEADNYRLMREYFAQVLWEEIAPFLPANSTSLLDVGGGQGEFCAILEAQHGLTSVNLDPYAVRRTVHPTAVKGWAKALPFADNTFDVVISRGVVEHIPPAQRLVSLQEMYRITKPNGICYITIPPWFNPHAGHGLKPFHLLPFPVAKALKKRLFGYKTKAKTYAQEGLYPLTFRGMQRYIETAGYELLDTKDTHLRLHFMTRIPILKELLVPAVSFIMRKN